MKRSIILIVLLTFGACSFHQTIAEHAIDYNKTVAQADDAQTLLNILRARDYLPMHFTAINSFTGQLEQSAQSSFALTVPFGGDAPREFPFESSLTVSESSSPLFTINVLSNSQEFMNAVLRPIEMETVRQFWDQGWPKDFLIYLLVEKIGVEETSKSPFAFEDIPELSTACAGVGSGVSNKLDPRQFACFRAIVDLLVGPKSAKPKDLKSLELRLVTSLSGTPIGPELNLTELKKDLEHLLEVKRDELDLVKLGEDRYQLCRVTSEIKLCIQNSKRCEPIVNRAEACRQDKPQTGAGSAPGDTREEKDSSEDRDVSDKIREEGQQIFDLEVQIEGGRSKYIPSREGEDQKRAKQENVKKLRFTAHLRSLQGMLYYVGELVRHSKESKVRVYVPDDSECPQPGESGANGKSVPLFALLNGDPTTGSTAVRHAGQSYWVKAGDECSRSLQTLAFFNQILGLYQSRADLPGSTLVQTIDR